MKKLFHLILAFIFMNYTFANLIQVQDKNEPSESQIINALKSFCNGKSKNFCSSQHLKLSMKILQDKELAKKQEIEIAAIREMKNKNKNKQNTEKIKQLMDEKRRKILKDLREHFLVRYI